MGTERQPVGHFEAKAAAIEVDGTEMVGVWADGVLLSADNGKSPMMSGMSAPCTFKLEQGKRYRVTVEEIAESTE